MRGPGNLISVARIRKKGRHSWALSQRGVMKCILLMLCVTMQKEALSIVEFQCSLRDLLELSCCKGHGQLDAPQEFVAFELQMTRFKGGFWTAFVGGYDLWKGILS